MAKIDSVPVLTEGPRGCGHRKSGGLYLVSDGLGEPCGKLPLPLHRCPTCSGGIKPSRGWTWIAPAPLFADAACHRGLECIGCPLSTPGAPPLLDGSRHGLLWIGEQFYKTVASWVTEVEHMGVSRRISAVPKGFEIGKTWVFVAHRLACIVPCECVDEEGKSEALCDECGGSGRVHGPGIFHVFKPKQMQYVCHGDETDREIDDLEKRGIVPVLIDRVNSATVGSPIIEPVP